MLGLSKLFADMYNCHIRSSFDAGYEGWAAGRGWCAEYPPVWRLCHQGVSAGVSLTLTTVQLLLL